MKKKLTLLAFVVAILMPMAALAQDDTCTVTLPWNENFDSYTTTGGTTMPDCWTRVSAFQVNAGSNAVLRPNFYIFTYGDHGTVLNFMGQGSGQGTMKIATPLIPASLNAIEISFDVYKNGLTVYLAIDPADESTYTLVGTYSPGYMWTTYEVRTDTLTGAPAEQGYIVFAADYGSSYGSYATAYLDNLSVVSLNNCERPVSVSVSNIGPDYATISWPEVDGAVTYSVYYDTVDDFASVDVGNFQEVSSTSVTLDELQPGAQYNVWVQTNCAEGVSDPRTTSFTTQLACYSLLGFAQTGSTFDAASFSWEYSALGFASTGVMAVLHDMTDATIADVVSSIEAGATSYIFTDLDNTHEYTVTLYTICGTDTAAAVSSGIYFRSCGESPLTNGGYDKSATCPIAPGYDASTSMMLYESDILFSMDTINGIALHRTTSGSAVARTLNIYMGHTVLDSLTSNPGTNGMQQVATNHLYTLGLQEWDTLMFDAPFVFNGSSNVLVAINDVTGTHEGGSPVEWYWHNAETKTYYSTTWNGSASSFSSYNRPDVRFVGQCNNEMNCNPPVVAIGEVDSVQAVVGWYGPIATDYIVQYRTQGENAWISVDTVDALDYTLTGLQAATHYEARVGIVCDTAVRFSNAVAFETSCALMHLPFHFTQGNMSTVAEHGNSFSDCWSFSQYIFKGKLTNSHRGYVRNVDLNQWIMLPAIAEPLSGARLRTWVASGDHGYFAVGVVEGDDFNTAVWLDTIEVNSSNPDVSHDEYISYLDQYTGAGNRIVIQPIVNNAYHYMYFFDFHVEEITECMPVRNLTLDSADANSLSFHWTPRGDASEWIVYVDGDSVAVVSDEPSYTATGLQPYTSYTISVSSVCGTDDLSTPLAEQFRTGCAGDECYVTLVGHAAEGDGWHGSHLFLMSNGEEVENFTMLLGSDLSREVRVCQSATISLTWLSVNDAEVCSFALLNGVGDTIYSFADGSAVDDGELLVTDSICTYDPSNVPSCSDRYEALAVEVCDSYLWRGQTLVASGQYADTVFGAVDGGCDSIFSLALTVNHSVSQTIDTTANDSFVWNGTVYTTSGNYSYESLTAEGCDSTVMLNLVITHDGCDNIYDTVEASACNTYAWRGNTYTASGSYSSIVPGVVEGSCDSIYILLLAVNYNIEATEAAAACDSYTWHGQTFTTSGTYNYVASEATADGCDSIYHLNLGINHSVSLTEEATANGSYSWNGQTYSQSGTYEWHGQTAAGCDLTVTLNLVLTHDGCDNIYDTAEASACNTYSWRGNTYTASGSYSSIVPGVVEGGCDSIYILLLAVNYNIEATEAAAACDSYTWHGQTFTTSGTYNYVASEATADGCDSIYRLDLDINHSVSLTEEATANGSYSWNGQTYSQSGTYEWHGQTAEGCDIIVTLNLVLTHDGCDNIYDTVEASACNTYAWRGNTYTASGSYSSIVPGVVEGSCDSIYILLLAVNYNIEATEAAAACDSYTWHGQTFTTSGTYDYVASGATADGCDSIYHLNLVVNHSVSQTIEATANGSYSWNGQTYSQSGTYEWHVQTAAGCDSTVTLVLTITQGIDDVEGQELSLYPNPTTGKVKVVAVGVKQIEVYDAVGRKVMSTTNDNVDLIAMADGIYTLRIVTSEGVAVRRVMKH